MENISYDLYIVNGGLVPRSVVIKRSVTDDKQNKEFANDNKDVLLKIKEMFSSLARMGTHLDEIEHTHPLVKLILVEFLNYTNTSDLNQDRFDKPDFVGSVKNTPSIPVEVKAFYYRDLGKAHGAKEGENATQQISRYIQKRSANIFGSLDVGILTNGRDWRLQDARGNFIEFDLEALVRDGVDESCPRSPEALSKLKLFKNFFGANLKFRRSLLFEGANIWAESYTAFRQRYSHLMESFYALNMSDASLEVAKELSLWMIFIRSLEDLGALPASPHHVGSEYYKRQLISHSNWSKYKDKAELSRLIDEIANNVFSASPVKCISTLPNFSVIEKWDKVYQEFTDFLFMSDKQTPFDFGDLYSREFGMIYVNLITDSKEHSAYFTSPKLAFSAAAQNENTNLEKSVKTFDVACGSGTLLRASYEQQVRESIKQGKERPSITNFFGCDIEKLSVLLCKMNLWIGSAKRGLSLPNLDNNVVVKNVFDVWSSIHKTGSKSFVQEIWSKEIKQGDALAFIANPPWGESSSEVDAVRNNQRSKISDSQKASIEALLKKISVSTLADNLYIPFLLAPFLEANLNPDFFSEIKYTFILPDQFFVGTQREGLRKALWPSVSRYFCHNNNRQGHFEGSIMGDNPDPNMRFGVVTGSALERQSGIKVQFPDTSKSKSLPRSCRSLFILPLYSCEQDYNYWKNFFDGDQERIKLSWHKGEINRKGSNRTIVKNLPSFGGKNSCRILCSSQGEWRQLLGKNVDPKVLSNKVWSNELLAHEKYKLFLKKRMVVPAQLSSGTGNTYSSDRITLSSHLIVTDNWHWIDSAARNYSKIQKILNSVEWSAISRALATRRSLPIALLNSLGLPDVDVNELSKTA